MMIICVVASFEMVFSCGILYILHDAHLVWQQSYKIIFSCGSRATWRWPRVAEIPPGGSGLVGNLLDADPTHLASGNSSSLSGGGNLSLRDGDKPTRPAGYFSCLSVNGDPTHPAGGHELLGVVDAVAAASAARLATHPLFILPGRGVEINSDHKNNDI